MTDTLEGRIVALAAEAEAEYELFMRCDSVEDPGFQKMRRAYRAERKLREAEVLRRPHNPDDRKLRAQAEAIVRGNE